MTTRGHDVDVRGRRFKDIVGVQMFSHNGGAGFFTQWMHGMCCHGWWWNQIWQWLFDRHMNMEGNGTHAGGLFEFGIMFWHRHYGLKCFKILWYYRSSGLVWVVYYGECSFTSHHCRVALDFSIATGKVDTCITACYHWHCDAYIWMPQWSRWQAKDLKYSVACSKSKKHVWTRMDLRSPAKWKEALVCLCNFMRLWPTVRWPEMLALILSPYILLGLLTTSIDLWVYFGFAAVFDA